MPETTLPSRAETEIHLLSGPDLDMSLCGVYEPVRAITEEEANDPKGRHFTCRECLKRAGQARFQGEDE